MRSWESMTTFLEESFGITSFVDNRPEGIAVSDVEYTGVDGTELKSYLATPSEDWARPLPAVVIVPYVPACRVWYSDNPSHAARLFSCEGTGMGTTFTRRSELR